MKLKKGSLREFTLWITPTRTQDSFARFAASRWIYAVQKEMHTGKQCTVNVTSSSMRYPPMMNDTQPETALGMFVSGTEQEEQETE